ncbi:hypothetical protein IFM89_004813 [Coptis chinensis]|uniref:K+ potassium transporter integral membrane domain-containing protein n=1 Tax=Coptis chinensis TaxID=261450 RepID=A0A835IWW3_9MAGN|nr:hypothetical protein IFM89_004813 [Coptis chinensis]
MSLLFFQIAAGCVIELPLVLPITLSCLSFQIDLPLPNFYCEQPISTLSAAVLENSLPSVKLLIEASANLNIGTCGVVPIVVAATQIETEMIKCLLKEGADPNVLEHWWNIKALESEEVTEKRKVKAKEKFNEAKSQGETAFRKKEYLLATKWYSMATNLDPSDVNVYSNRSLCYALLKGEVALADASACINLKHESSMASTPSIDEEERNRGSMWVLDQKIDKPMDEEVGRLRNMYMAKTFSSLLVLRLAFQSLGIVYGDLGTSPLYVFYNTFLGGIDDPEDVIGALSMIIYSLTLIPLLKYVFVVLRANDNGQGGTFALYSLLCRHAKIKTIPNQHWTDEELTTYSRHTFHEKSFAAKTKKWLEAQAYRQTALLILVLVGTCMVIGDVILTPAISGLT